ncbi:tyrosine-type recombinase/integrase [Deinococcus peraridilitoris]|uniref:Site-specific recombinase XerD n=1 Tax=Deinococcus peraridilitoris (strain DSM 19664 / LMG 22246 / CIP 109416 / KR-200) TaxID=937777 RepID=L0A024_DEIPD|nr:site-specific integrase [Deinococcus peraridilitoris]AFZ67181.1 site-specific recombinase XerD [Deinococcus peraridilitoris DSM 19664]
MKRRDNGEGCVKKLPSGSHRWQITLGFDEHGRQILKSGTERNRKDADQARIQALADHQRGLLPIPSQITLADWLPRWLELKRPNLAPKTYANYKYAIEKHLTPLLGKKKLQDLKPSDVKGAYGQLADRGFSRSLLHQIRVILRQALQEALLDELVARNVAEVARLPSFKRGKTARALDAGQLQDFLVVARKRRLGLLFEFVVATGLRRGEVVALRWANVDLDAGVLHVRENVTVVDGQPVLGPPKTESGIRTLHLAPETVALLHKHRKAQDEEQRTTEDWRDSGSVFTNRRGERLHPDTLSHFASVIADKAKLGGVRFHDLRHSYASLMLSKGVPMEVVSEKLGHSRPSTTADIYRHVFLEEHERHTWGLPDLLTPVPLRLRSAAKRHGMEEEPAA